MNVIDYALKNFKFFSEILDTTAKTNKSSKKEALNSSTVNSNPLGTLGLSSRNGTNKDNFGGNSNTTNKNISSKCEKKMHIKQNIQIAISFLKKICRLTKQNQEKFKELLAILSSIETGNPTPKVKDQIMRAMQSVKLDYNNQQ